MPFKWNTSTNTIQWDNNGTATDATDNQYINSYLILSNIAGKARHLIVPGRTAYTTLAAAQAEDPSTFTFNGFPSAEFVMVYQLTWYANLSGGGADTSSGRCSLIATPKKIAVGAIATSSTAGSVDHNSLSGLQGGIANEYYHLTSTEHTDVALIPGITSNVSTLQSSVTAIEANTSNWNTAYSWGDHSTEGYLTAETDPFFTAWDKSTGISITESQISDLQTYLTAETDPVFLASNAAGILGTDITNWNTAHGWGDHSAAGYALTSSLANVATTGSYTDLSNTPSIPDSILDLGITDGTTGQVLSTDGSGAFTFTDVVSSPGGDDTQFQFNNSGAFSGSSLLTTDGSSVFVSNLQVTNATITNTTSAWQTASNGNLGPVIIGDQITFSSTNDPLNFARNGRMIAGATVTTDGSTYSSVRRSALTTAAVWNHTNGNVTWGNNDRLIGMSSVVTFVGNGATITGVNNGWLNTSNYYTQVNNATVPWAGSGNNYVYALNGAVVQKGYGHKSTFNTNNATIEKFASYVCHLDYMSGTPSVGDTAGLYMGPEYGTSDSFINLSGSVPAQYQTGTNYYLLNNNKTAVSKLGTVKTVDEWVERVSGPEVGTPAAVDLDLSVSNAYEISLNQAGYISELTFSGLNSTTTSSGARMHSATIIFKQDATGGVQVNWPAGTKFAGGIDQIDLTADSVTFVSVMIWDSVYYVTVGVYE
jgi:hypothetical protein